MIFYNLESVINEIDVVCWLSNILTDRPHSCFIERFDPEISAYCTLTVDSVKEQVFSANYLV